MDQTDGDGMFGAEHERQEAERQEAMYQEAANNLGGYTPEEWAAVEAQEAAQIQSLDAKFTRIEAALDAFLGKHRDRTNLERELYAARDTLKQVSELASAYEAKAENCRRGGSYNLQGLYTNVSEAIREALKGDQADGE